MNIKKAQFGDAFKGLRIDEMFSFGGRSQVGFPVRELNEAAFANNFLKTIRGDFFQYRINFNCRDFNSVENKLKKDGYKIVFSNECLADTIIRKEFIFIANKRMIRMEFANNMVIISALTCEKSGENLREYLLSIFQEFSFTPKTNNKIPVYFLLENKEVKCIYINKIDSNLSLNYGEGFIQHNEKITNLLKNNRMGLYLFTGDPGTGKTSYIKFLISEFPNKQFIYVDSSLAYKIDSPSSLLDLVKQDTKELVLIIEDSENLLSSRDENFHSPVTKILNICDGFLGNAFGISVIATLNLTDKIDKAVLRKGRLKYRYNFDKLNREESQKKIDSLGISFQATGPMTLGDIYNLSEDNNFEMAARKIGF